MINEKSGIIDKYINEKIEQYNLHKEVDKGIYGIWIAPNLNRLFKVKHQVKSTRFEFREKKWFPNRFADIPKGEVKEYDGFKVSWLEEPYNRNKACNMIVTVLDFQKAKPYLDKFIDASVEAASKVISVIIDKYINEKIVLYNLHKEVDKGIYGIWIAPKVNRLFKVKHQVKSTRFEFREKKWFPNRFADIPKGEVKEYDGFKVSWLEEPYYQSKPCNMIVTVFDFQKAKPYLDKFIDASVEAAFQDM